MKRISIILIILAFSVFGYSQRNIKKVDIKETGFQLSLVLKPITNKFHYDNGINVEITPVSADDLNSLFLDKNNLNGIFNYSYYEKSRNSYFLKKQKKVSQSDLSFILEGLDWLQDNDKITDDEYDKLYSMAVTELTDDTKVSDSNTDNIITCNPYYLSGHYMNVFKIEISNTTNSPLLFDDQIVVKYKNSLLHPLSSEFLLNELGLANSLNLGKSLTLQRYNLDIPISIPSNSVVVKYFSVLPIDFSADILYLYSPELNKQLSWEVAKTKNDISNSYSFYELVMSTYCETNAASSAGKHFHLIITKDPSSFYIDRNKLFIESNSINVPFSVLSISTQFDKFYFGRTESMAAKDFLILPKSQRKSIRLDLIQAEGLKKN